jgi:hypothetical protein
MCICLDQEIVSTFLKEYNQFSLRTASEILLISYNYVLFVAYIFLGKQLL